MLVLDWPEYRRAREQFLVLAQQPDLIWYYHYFRRQLFDYLREELSQQFLVDVVNYESVDEIQYSRQKLDSEVLRKFLLHPVFIKHLLLQVLVLLVIAFRLHQLRDL